MRRASFLTGVAAGYLLGSRAGRKRYDAVRLRVRDLAERPETQEAAGLLRARLAEAGQRLQGGFTGRAGRVRR